MPKKRKSRGRGKGGKGHESRAQCDGCGAWVPKSKLKKVTRYMSLVDPQLRKELERKGTMIPTMPITKQYCVSCAVYQGVVKVRAESMRKTFKQPRR